MRPVRLRCEYQVEPLAVTFPWPHLSWELEAEGRGRSQSAYRILVASSAENLAGSDADVWDSGRVASQEMNHVPCEQRGRRRPEQRLYWKVRVWDERGRIGPWSEAAWWTVQPFVIEWETPWIGLHTEPSSDVDAYPALCLPPVRYLRTEFHVRGTVSRALLHASALGLFEARLNGKRVGRDHFTPGWTDYNRRVYFLTYDVTEQLRPGPNAIAALLADGWYAGYVGFGLLANFPKARGFYGDEPAFLAQLAIEYEDGGRETVNTGPEWRAATGAILEADILMGETYDARLEPVGWDEPGFDDTRWFPVEGRGAPEAPFQPHRNRYDEYANELGTWLEAYPGPRVRTFEELLAIERTEPKPGVFIFDLGQNFAGWARLKVSGAAGTRVVLRFGEMLHLDGSLATENLRHARCTDTYILNGEGEEVWEPRFTYHGFRYVEVTGYPGLPPMEAITGIVAHSDTPLVGSFECSDPMVNQLYRNIVWTQRSNFFEVPTDCPQRDERLGWTGDAQIYVRSATFNADVAAFFRKWLIDLDDSQLPEGPYPNFAPWIYPWSFTPDSPAWADAGIICPHAMYRVYGDIRCFINCYPDFVGFLNFMESHSKGLVRPPAGHGDWLSIGEDCPREVIATAYFAYDAHLYAELAAAIGHGEHATHYRALFERVRDAFNRAFVSEDGKIHGDTQTGYALALMMDLLPEEKRPLAAAHLVKAIERRDWHLATGFVGVRHLLPALSRNGYTDVAYRLLLNRTYPSWGYSIEQGATTIWERWNSWTKDQGFGDPGMNSFNHYSLGSVCEWLFDTVAGISDAAPGFREVLIHPQPGGGLTWARGRYHSIRGPILSEWHRQEDRFRLVVEIPPNTRATVVLPTGDAAGVRESGTPVEEAAGVEVLRQQAEQVRLQIGSGRYEFECPMV
jgi:alpha-L-rhamnosidase